MKHTRSFLRALAATLLAIIGALSIFLWVVPVDSSWFILEWRRHTTAFGAGLLAALLLTLVFLALARRSKEES